jgi:hypothetical protein
LIGVIFGFGVRQAVATAFVWYAALAWQTAYIAHVGRAAFGGKDGLETVHWWVYWVVQPLLLIVALGFLWLGSKVHAIVGRRITGQPDPSSAPI